MPKQSYKNRQTTGGRARARGVGLADQMGYEAQESYERNTMKDRLASQRRTSKAAGMKRAAQKRKEKGANAGTIGGSRGALMSAFFGRSR